MKATRKYKIIASFLLFLFSLNTVTGFACSIGLDLGYNKEHHKPKQASGHHQDHELHNKVFTENLSPVLQDGSHPSDCCANDVTSFNKLDKSAVKTNLELKVPLSPLFYKYNSASQNERIVEHSVNRPFYNRRCCSLSHTDIRIAIQSFQI